jgi:glucose-1-phosphate adenylyltransferase
MKIRSIILAGGEGTRLSVLTSKRTKPAVPFGGIYRIIDFTLSNCINSNIFDIMIIAQYRPHSLQEHIGAGGPWDLNREFSGGVRIFTPYRAIATGWFRGTADAVQQNFSFIKRGDPDLILILSGDHIYTMNYQPMIDFHVASQADVTIATLEVPIEEANRFGIIDIDEQQRVTSFVEKPSSPPSNLANMGIYLFSRSILNKVLWEDHLQQDSSHDFGTDIIPRMIREGFSLIAFPYRGYWVDVGTVESYWKAHMDLLSARSPLDLYDPSWIIYTREEKKPPSFIHSDAKISNSLISNGCIIEGGAKVTRSVLSPGVHVQEGAEIYESIILTETLIKKNAVIQRSILDKRITIGDGAKIGEVIDDKLQITMIGKNSVIPANMTLKAGCIVGTDVVPSDFGGTIIYSGEHVQTRRLPNEF